MKSVWTNVCALLLAGVTLADEQPRIWTAGSGEQVQAVLIAYSDQHVALQTADGRVITQLASKLAVDDQLYLKEHPELHVNSPQMRASTVPVKTQTPAATFFQRKTSRQPASQTQSRGARLNGARGLNGARSLDAAKGL